ncbi:uncharacterized protein LOC131224124 [Magnolia sinica]|uniref:uncharacterized protein LOC131224124 n=1 Tax=Magnolia sinica TaxID=86752 RepID=UPI00265A911D|nr:uncharacterized protein LOC131224124 [Magnolia sinica]
MAVGGRLEMKNLTDEFEEITLSYMPRAKNQFADALTTLASMLEILRGTTEWKLIIKLWEEPAFCLQIDEAETLPNNQPQYTDIREYLEHQKCPEGAISTDRCTIQRPTTQFTITGGSSTSDPSIKFFSVAWIK